MIRKINVVSPYIPLAVKVADEKQIEPALLCAFVMCESSWNTHAQNHGMGDEELGGAYGLGQMTMRTAASLGYHGDHNGLLEPRTNLELVADLIKENTRVGETTTDIITRYNCGKPANRAPTFTMTVYVPRVLNYLQLYRAFFAPQPTSVADATGHSDPEDIRTLASPIKPV